MEETKQFYNSWYEELYQYIIGNGGNSPITVELDKNNSNLKKFKEIIRRLKEVQFDQQIENQRKLKMIIASQQFHRQDFLGALTKQLLLLSQYIDVELQNKTEKYFQIEISILQLDYQDPLSSIRFSVNDGLRKRRFCVRRYQQFEQSEIGSIKRIANLQQLVKQNLFIQKINIKIAIEMRYARLDPYYMIFKLDILAYIDQNFEKFINKRTELKLLSEDYNYRSRIFQWSNNPTNVILSIPQLSNEDLYGFSQKISNNKSLENGLIVNLLDNLSSVHIVSDLLRNDKLAQLVEKWSKEVVLTNQFEIEKQKIISLEFKIVVKKKQISLDFYLQRGILNPFSKKQQNFNNNENRWYYQVANIRVDDIQKEQLQIIWTEIIEKSEDAEQFNFFNIILIFNQIKLYRVEKLRIKYREDEEYRKEQEIFLKNFDFSYCQEFLFNIDPAKNLNQINRDYMGFQPLFEIFCNMIQTVPHETEQSLIMKISNSNLQFQQVQYLGQNYFQDAKIDQNHHNLIQFFQKQNEKILYISYTWWEFAGLLNKGLKPSQIQIYLNYQTFSCDSQPSIKEIVDQNPKIRTIGQSDEDFITLFDIQNKKLLIKKDFGGLSICVLGLFQINKLFHRNIFNSNFNSLEALKKNTDVFDLKICGEQLWQHKQSTEAVTSFNVIPYLVQQFKDNKFILEITYNLRSKNYNQSDYCKYLTMEYQQQSQSNLCQVFQINKLLSLIIKVPHRCCINSNLYEFLRLFQLKSTMGMIKICKTASNQQQQYIQKVNERKKALYRWFQMAKILKGSIKKYRKEILFEILQFLPK